jgi:Family of unknown function (DUF6328)
MPAIETRLKDLLDETRLAMLGTQLLMGLQYNAAFAQRFGGLPDALRRLDGIALLLILTAAAFLLPHPPSRATIRTVWGGDQEAFRQL